MRQTLIALALSLAVLGCKKEAPPKPAATPPTPSFAPPSTAPAPVPAEAPKPAAPPAPTAAASPPPAAPAPGSNWVTWVHPKKLISAKFPGAAQESESEAPSALGPVKFTMAMHADNTRAFMVGATVYELPEGASFDVAKALDGARDQMLANIKATATAEQAIQLDGYDGKNVEFEAPGPEGQKIHGVARVFAGATPPTGYFAGAFRMTEAADPDFTTFLDSIHLGKAVEAPQP